eukprot:TRINITY_DN4329_c0_g2_i1.p1 TRINITY_DN4329_c0_g2~~TRINITY_DN4329_c0_g2_i1.p1  ORF type:complete len:1250 (+),score=312.02 TRINITY_DN4329_c0_g2_i1:77-3826(+)
MSIESLISASLDEIAFEGRSGCKFSQLVECLKSRGWELDIYLQNFVWKALVARQELSFHTADALLSQADLLQLEHRDDVTIKPSIALLQRVLGVTYSDLTALQLSILEMCARSRSTGVTVEAAAQSLGVDPKQLFYHTKKLGKLGVVQKELKIFGKKVMNMYTHTRFTKATEAKLPANTNDMGRAIQPPQPMEDSETWCTFEQSQNYQVINQLKEGNALHGLSLVKAFAMSTRKATSFLERTVAVVGGAVRAETVPGARTARYVYHAAPAVPAAAPSLFGEPAKGQSRLVRTTIVDAFDKLLAHLETNPIIRMPDVITLLDLNADRAVVHRRLADVEAAGKLHVYSVPWRKNGAMLQKVVAKLGVSKEEVIAAVCKPSSSDEESSESDSEAAAVEEGPDTTSLSATSIRGTGPQTRSRKRANGLLPLMLRLRGLHWHFWRLAQTAPDRTLDAVAAYDGLPIFLFHQAIGLAASTSEVPSETPLNDLPEHLKKLVYSPGLRNLFYDYCARLQEMKLLVLICADSTQKRFVVDDKIVVPQDCYLPDAEPDRRIFPTTTELDVAMFWTRLQTSCLEQMTEVTVSRNGTVDMYKLQHWQWDTQLNRRKAKEAKAEAAATGVVAPVETADEEEEKKSDKLSTAGLRQRWKPDESYLLLCCAAVFHRERPDAAYVDYRFVAKYTGHTASACRNHLKVLLRSQALGQRLSFNAQLLLNCIRDIMARNASTTRATPVAATATMIAEMDRLVSQGTEIDWRELVGDHAMRANDAAVNFRLPSTLAEFHETYQLTVERASGKSEAHAALNANRSIMARIITTLTGDPCTPAALERVFLHVSDEELNQTMRNAKQAHVLVANKPTTVEQQQQTYRTTFRLSAWWWECLGSVSPFAPTLLRETSEIMRQPRVVGSTAAHTHDENGCRVLLDLTLMSAGVAEPVITDDKLPRADQQPREEFSVAAYRSGLAAHLVACGIKQKPSSHALRIAFELPPVNVAVRHTGVLAPVQNAVFGMLQTITVGPIEPGEVERLSPTAAVALESIASTAEVGLSQSLVDVDAAAELRGAGLIVSAPSIQHRAWVARPYAGASTIPIAPTDEVTYCREVDEAKPVEATSAAGAPPATAAEPVPTTTIDGSRKRKAAESDRAAKSSQTVYKAAELRTWTSARGEVDEELLLQLRGRLTAMVMASPGISEKSILEQCEAISSADVLDCLRELVEQNFLEQRTTMHSRPTLWGRTPEVAVHVYFAQSAGERMLQVC